MNDGQKSAESDLAIGAESTPIRRLLPPPELTPPPPGRTPAECVAAWFDLVETTDRIFWATLLATHKTEAEAKAAYRAAYAEWERGHEEKIRNICECMRRARENRGG